MPNRRRQSTDPPWEVDGVSAATQEAATKAAAGSGVPLEIWLADTVLRASQEGGSEPTPQVFVATTRRPLA